MKPQVLVMNKFLQPAVNMISDNVEAVKLWEIHDTKVLTKYLRNIRGIMSSAWDIVDASFLENTPKLEIIAHMATGVDAIDITAAKKRGIVVTNTPNIVTEDTADLAMGLLLNLSRKILQNHSYVMSGSWGVRPCPLGISLKNKKLGIVGLGKVGLEIAKRAEAFKLQIYYWDIKEKHNVNYYYVDRLDTLAKMSDYLIISCAGTRETKNLIDYSVLKNLGRDSFLINISRGFVVNEIDLVNALQNKTIAGAALDVFENEPQVPQEFLKMENVVLQPHVGTATVETREAMYRLTANNIIQYFREGTALTPYNIEAIL